MLKFIHSWINDPLTITIICAVCIALYYIVSVFFIWLSKRTPPHPLFKKGGFIDWTTSVISVLCNLLLIYNLFYFCVVKMTIGLGYLVVYYFLFIFLFAIIYGIIDWHWPNNMFEGIPETGKWKAEARYLLISLQTQTTLGYTSSKPKDLKIELLTCIQALLGIFFITIFISLSINAFKS